MKLLQTFYMIICSFAIFCTVDSANLKESSEQRYDSHGRKYYDHKYYDKKYYDSQYYGRPYYGRPYYGRPYYGHKYYKD